MKRIIEGRYSISIRDDHLERLEKIKSQPGWSENETIGNMIGMAVDSFLMEKLVTEFADAEQKECVRRQKIRDAFAKRQKKYKASVREILLPDELVDKLGKIVSSNDMDTAVNAAIWEYSEIFDESLGEMPPYWDQEDEDGVNHRVFRCQTCGSFMWLPLEDLLTEDARGMLSHCICGESILDYIPERKDEILKIVETEGRTQSRNYKKIAERAMKKYSEEE